MSKSKAEDAVSDVGSSGNESPPEKKRKRSKTTPKTEDELEIDVNLPEPPSKKAKRREKKGKPALTPGETEDSKDHNNHPNGLPFGDGNDDNDTTAAAGAAPTTTTTPGRTDFGIWIGNLPFSATRDSLRDFLQTQGGIEPLDIVRLHLPAPAVKDKTRPTVANRGFAYIDFTAASVVQVALGLSEKLLLGRRVLIKESKIFEGRPEKKEEASGAVGGLAGSKKEPARRIFVGNLGFDVGREELAEHFCQAGVVEDVHMATFEDSGKCKGFGWVTFDSIEAASQAVRGWVFKDADEGGEEEEVVMDGGERKGEGKKRKEKKMKWFINRLHGRTMRCEFAEDSQTRYKKRFGKAPREDGGGGGFHGSRRNDAGGAAGYEGELQSLAGEAATARQEKKPKPDKDQRREERRKRHDARTVAPGAALAMKDRASNAIVEGKGKKTSFE